MTERSSRDVPKPKKAKKKQAHRGEVWQYFVEKEGIAGVANCRCCAQQIGCDTKLHGTSFTRHIKSLVYQELGTHKRLCNNSQAKSTGNKSGDGDDLAQLFKEDGELESKDSLYDELATETVNDVATRSKTVADDARMP
ncbi:predicted protein [Arabidopsis lyrata subsp. lyrata]|uniref:Predicted protein n=1 Tax=Arabidopsis lyrata subsp. lyrata TaxID=81972 RepID=D7M6W3_ARALL|nr:predicted protein [Arabidopsis lyrata subsp. lyrata]